LVGHEITHIVHGHVGFLTSRKDDRMYTESASITEPDNIELQALEADADQRSFISRLESLRLTLSDGRLAWYPNGINPEQLAFDLSFAVDALFRLFGDQPFVGLDLSKRSHPPRPLRRLLLMLTGAMGADGLFAEPLEGVSRTIFGEAAVACEHAFSLVLGEERATTGMQEAASIYGREYVKWISQIWNQGDLSKRLEPFAFI